MHTRLLRALAYLSPLVLATVAAAQEPVTITGHVSASAMPLRGAEIQVPELGIGAVSDASGRYSFIIPSSRVRGQTVTLTVRSLRYRTESAPLALVGGSVTMDFVMRPMSSEDARADAPPPVTDGARTVGARTDGARADGARTDVARTDAARTDAARTDAARAVARVTPTPQSVAAVRVPAPAYGRLVGASAFLDAAGPVELPALLTGRLTGVDVRSAASAGGSVALQARGARSLLGSTEPLFVVDGVLMDNESITTTAQRNGLGGFDAGGAVNGLEPFDVASVELLVGPEAAMRYGGRAANGVLLVTTRTARGLEGFAVSASQNLSFETPTRLPEYQNAYGQGLGGRFSFFDGRGGGVNDSVSQSWGPALDGSPVIQASLVEAGRPVVRAFTAQPDNVRDYFGRGHVITTNVAVQGASETRHFRLSATNRSNAALTPATSLGRQSLAFTGETDPTPHSALGASLRYSHEHASELPGTGMSEGNPVSVFAMTPRQVDVAALRAHLFDAAQRQVNWNYSSHDNPYFAALANDNGVTRSQLLGGLSASGDLSPWVKAVAVAGLHRSSETRDLTVARGFIGGFPYFGGRSDSAGVESGDFTVTSMNADAGLRTAGATSPVAASIGAGVRSSGLDATDTFAGGVGVSLPTPPSFSADTRAVYVRGALEATGDAGSIVASARGERTTALSSSASTVYPALLATLDLARLADSRRFGSLSLHAGWSRSGNDPSPFVLQRLGVVRGSTADVGAVAATPERTSGWEAGLTSASMGGRAQLDLRAYRDVTDDLLLPTTAGLFRGASMSNAGLEAAVLLVPLRVGDVMEWQVGANWARNTNRVETLADRGSAVTLAGGPGGLLVQARVGQPLASLVGTRFLRDGSGALLLRDGLPLPDSAAGPQLLGGAAARWIGGLTSTLRYRGVELSVVADTRVGGQVFSASNQAAAYAGVAAETGFRPDSGLLVEGRDVATGAANGVHVTTEDYYHALGPITERWIYDATFVKLREARLSIALPLRALPLFRAQSVRLAVIGRNLALWTRAPNIDPETVLSTSPLLGVEMGQLPSARSLGVQLSLAP